MSYILVVNIGSTSLKYRLLQMPGGDPLTRGYIERIGGAASPYSWQTGKHKGSCKLDTSQGTIQAISAMLDMLVKGAGATPPVLRDINEVAGVGFKVVHGGYSLRTSARITEHVLACMEDFSRVMPAHNPPYIQAIREFQRLLPDTPLVGAFETAFHRDMPDYASVYGLPYAWTEQLGVRRYGFHGASHRYVSERAAELHGHPLEDLRVLVCHLGGSSSLAAVQHGVCVATSMGFTTQSGLPMAKRSGDLDPFALPYLMEKTGKSLQEILDVLVTQSGLAGISGLSGDMRDLEEQEATNPRAHLAIAHFVHEIKKYLGAFAAVMNGLDVVAFTGGIGENSARIRRDVCADMDVLGIELDDRLNDNPDGERCISAPGSQVAVYRIPTNEEFIVARETLRCLAEQQGGTVSDYSSRN
ncbi:acetate/propionate family kinase [Oceanidesulfovibrio marinus]|uniref:Acetate kinase n=1 Tax=Oceanidesulfovibrio marinus TaxID=370038 RepID=A0A6P1ZKS6_9BACT|nr:acetate/propionate family kinase [Oceanidesulfovibrio marinus]TVM34663.1 hypothetical protein DQK91_08820 [Oceanidesulfovibrio marinus]